MSYFEPVFCGLPKWGARMGRRLKHYISIQTALTWRIMRLISALIGVVGSYNVGSYKYNSPYNNNIDTLTRPQMDRTRSLVCPLYVQLTRSPKP